MLYLIQPDDVPGSCHLRDEGTEEVERAIEVNNCLHRVETLLEPLLYRRQEQFWSAQFKTDGDRLIVKVMWKDRGTDLLSLIEMEKKAVDRQFSAYNRTLQQRFCAHRRVIWL